MTLSVADLTYWPLIVVLVVGHVMKGKRQARGWAVDAGGRAGLLVWAGFNHSPALINVCLVFFLLDLKYFRLWRQREVLNRATAQFIHEGGEGDEYDDEGPHLLGSAPRK